MNTLLEEKLNDAIDLKLDDLNQMRADDEQFKDACGGINSLIESSELPAQKSAEKKKMILSAIGTIASVVVPAVVCLFAWTKSIDMDNEGVIQPNTARSVFKEFKPKK